MKNVLLDTDILINFLRGNTQAREEISSLLDTAVLLCSVVTIAEIHAGMREHERGKTLELLESLTPLDITPKIAEMAGHYKRTIKSQRLELDDCFIAASAITKQALLVTGNGKHYPMNDIEKKIVTTF
jgi:predicted nucleic acid-binding protein